MEIQAITELSLHGLLVLIVIILWRRMVKLEAALVDCLSDRKTDTEKLRDPGLGV